jgi:hypothetical protein
MSQAAMNNLVAALKTGAGLKDDFIYYMPFDDYKTLPDPFARVPFTVKEVQESIAVIQTRKTRRAVSVEHYGRPFTRKIPIPTRPWS